MKTLVTKNVPQILLAGVVVALFAVTYITNPSFFKAPQAESAIVANANVSGWVWSLGTKIGTEAADNPAGPYSTTVGSNPGLGWISFNSTSDGSSQAYGVKVDTLAKGTGGLGNFSGNAWIGNRAVSETDGDTGWVSFDRAETGNPNPVWGDPGLSKPGTPLAYVDWSTGKVYGWMRVLTGMSAQAGGWDGWIKLSGTISTATYTGGSLVAGVPTPQCSCDSGAGYNCTAPFTGGDVGATCYDWWSSSGGPSKSYSRSAAFTNEYGVQIGGIVNGASYANKFSGYAWGGDVVGWVDFAPKIGGVSVGPVVGGGVTCSANDPINPGQPNPAVTWGSCQPLSQCSGSGTQNVAGIMAGSCPSGGGSVTHACTATITCTPPVVVAPPAGCNANPACDSGETPLTCPSQCKVKFRQF